MPASYAAHINITHISTSSKARNSRGSSNAVGAAKGNARYITRGRIDDADVIARDSSGNFIAGDKEAARALAYEAIDARAARYAKSEFGVRLADKISISLPNDATPEEHREMLKRIMTDLGKDSEAVLIGAIHLDREGNKHAHVEAFDGRESIESAKARRPDAKRVRRGDALRLNELGARKEWRAKIAGHINAIGQPAGRRFAEHRSLKEQGIDRAPQIHEGVEIRQKQERSQKKGEPRNWRLSSRATTKVRQNLGIIWDKAKRSKDILAAIPARWKEKRHWDMWERLILAEKKKKAEAAKKAVQALAADKPLPQPAPLPVAPQAATPAPRPPAQAQEPQAAPTAPEQPAREQEAPTPPPEALDSHEATQAAKGRAAARAAFDNAPRPPSLREQFEANKARVLKRQKQDRR